jgi:ABC-type transport system substrate-binding protein
MGDPIGIDTPPPAGTGPWKFVDRASGEYIRFERFEDHWRKVPDFRELEIRFVSETSTRMSGLLANESHMTILPPDLYSTVQDRGMEVITATANAVRVYLRYYGGTAQYNIQTGEPWFPDSPFLDLRVRKALNKAIDRDALNEAFLGGKGELGILASHHPTRPGWDPSWEERFEEEYGYDPDAARALLEEAGHGPDNPVNLVVIANFRPAAPWGVDMQETMIGYWQEIGVNAELLTVDSATISAQADNYELERHLEMLAPSSDLLVGTRVTHVNLLTQSDPDYQGNDSGVWLPGLDENYDELIAAGSDDEFEQLARELGENLFAGHALVPLFWIAGEVVVDPNVVAGWVWPGNAGDLISHTEYIEAVKA